MPSGKMFFGALLLERFFDSSCGAVGVDVVKAGAIMSESRGYLTLVV
jgi:hypothetical protein